MNIVRLYEGFISKGPKQPGGSEAYFGDVSEVSFVLKNALYNAQTLILDGVVVRVPPRFSTLAAYANAQACAQIYRTYKVWNNIYVVIVPIFGWLGLVGELLCAACAIVITVPHSCVRSILQWRGVLPRDHSGGVG